MISCPPHCTKPESLVSDSIFLRAELMHRYLHPEPSFCTVELLRIFFPWLAGKSWHHLSNVCVFAFKNQSKCKEYTSHTLTLFTIKFCFCTFIVFLIVVLTLLLHFYRRFDYRKKIYSRKFFWNIPD